jgi:ABC-type uncharacterized transport system permease subunit
MITEANKNMTQTIQAWVEEVTFQGAQVVQAIAKNTAAYWALVMGELVLGAALVLSFGPQTAMPLWVIGWGSIILAVTSGVRWIISSQAEPEPVPVPIRRD